MRMLMTFFSEFTTQSKTAFNLGTRLIVFKGRRTRSTRNDLIVERFWPALLPLLSGKWFPGVEETNHQLALVSIAVYNNFTMYTGQEDRSGIAANAREQSTLIGHEDAPSVRRHLGDRCSASDMATDGGQVRG